MAASSRPRNLTRRANEAASSAIADVDRLFCDRLRPLVRHEMGRCFRRTEDSEDVVQEAPFAFYRALADRRTQRSLQSLVPESLCRGVLALPRLQSVARNSAGGCPAGPIHFQLRSVSCHARS
jgi:hypothetical protein